jgi:hypothetical protein
MAPPALSPWVPVVSADNASTPAGHDLDTISAPSSPSPEMVDASEHSVAGSDSTIDTDFSLPRPTSLAMKHGTFAQGNSNVRYQYHPLLDGKNSS